MRAHAILALLFACGLARAGEDGATDRARAAIVRLNEVFWSPTLSCWIDRSGDHVRAFYDGVRNPPWWPSANAVESLLDFMDAAGTSEYEASLDALYDLRKDRRALTARVIAELKSRGQWSEADAQEAERRAAKMAGPETPNHGYYSDFQNEYLDDSGWWALAWLKMFDRTHAAKFLTTAKTIHAHMAKNWLTETGGGIAWREDEERPRPNAITNSLFLILSARLYERTKEAAFLEWAGKTLAWFREAPLYDGTAVVDRPGHRGDYWSYNQGAFIGGLTALFQATEKVEYLDEAVRVAGTVLRDAGLVAADGVLLEKIGTHGDACLFKGIFARYLAQLRRVLHARAGHQDTVQEIDRCLRATAAAIVESGTGANGLYPAEWHRGARDMKTNFGTQVSALAVLVAAMSSPR